MSQWGQGWALGQAGMAAGSAGGSTGLLTDPTPGAPARVQCPSSQQQTRAAPPSSDLGRGKCPALLQEGITPSTTMGVGRAGPGQEGQSVSHRLPQVMQEPRMVPQSQGQGQSPALPPTPATATQGPALLQGHGWVQHTVVLFPREEEGRGQGTNLKRMKTIHWK